MPLMLLCCWLSDNSIIQLVKELIPQIQKIAVWRCCLYCSQSEELGRFNFM